MPGNGGRINYTLRDTVTTAMICALRWAAMRAILMLHKLRVVQSQRQCPQTTTSEEKEEPEIKSGATSTAYQLNAMPLSQTGSRSNGLLLLVCGLMSSDVG